MNSSVAATTARTVVIALIIAAAAVAGLAVGNAIQGHRLGTITADAGFSLEKLQALQQLRGDNAPVAPAVAESSDYGIRHAVRAPAYADYGVRHAAAPRQDYIDYGVRHVTAPARIAFTDTFRLTGPSRVGIAPKQDFTDTFRLTGPSQLDDEDDWDGMVFGPPGR